MELREIQRKVKELVGEKDRMVGEMFLLSVLVEEVGELAEALRKRDRNMALEELADVLFMTLSIANQLDVDLEGKLVEKYLSRSLEEISRSWHDVPWKKQG